MTTILWAGSQESFDVVLAAEKQVAEGMKAGRFSGSADDGLPPLWRKEGSTAVIKISGSLIDGDSGWMRMFGVTGYNNIAEATIAAATDPDVKSLLFHISSSGGQVHGMFETAKLLGQVSAMKPSLTFTDSTMASAAYSLGSSIAGEIHSTPTAESGSIGVLTVAREISKQLERDGVTVKVMRSGDMKARINPFEAMTPEAEAHLQSQLNDVHDMFRAQVAKNRPKMTAEDLVQATDGRTFLGKRAVSAGLVDKVSSFEQALKLLDKHSATQDTSSNSKGGKKMNIVLTQQQLAAIQAGATPLSLGIVLEGSAEDQAAALAAATVADEVVEDPKPVVETADKKPDTVAAPPVDAVALLQAQLTTTHANLVVTQAELLNLKASTQSAKTEHEGLLAIARASVGKMMIALGGSDAAAQSMDAATAIAEHAKVSTTFLTKFKTGQQTAATPVDNKQASKIDPAFVHAVNNAKTRK